MRAHLRYLRYVLLHKFYVALGGLAILRIRGIVYEQPVRWKLAFLWRLLVHDLSKFRPSEWGPYVAQFYGDSSEALVDREAIPRDRDLLEHYWKRIAALKANRARAFDAAWLLHQHRNDHHWQHWMLHEDSGKTKVLLPPAIVVDEMIADWLGAGTKILRWPTIAEIVGETIVWYCRNRTQMQLREAARQRIEETLLMLAGHYGLADMAAEVASAQRARVAVSMNLAAP